jgi:hypothetical protein
MSRLGMADELFLPRAELAEVPEDKLRGYALNPNHPTGRHKARVFASALGIGATEWVFLRDQILDRVAGSPVMAIRPRAPYGLEYEVRIEIDGLNGETHSVITGWLLSNDDPPRLLTAYVEVRRRAR